MKHLPNALTISRIVLTPVMLVFLMANTLFGVSVALVLFLLGAISDYLDGKIARSFATGSRLGQFLDPFADKVLVLGTFVALAILRPEVVPWWSVIVIAARDLAVTALRTWAESRGRSIKTRNIARAKTVVQIVFIAYILAVMILTKMPGRTGAFGKQLLEGPISYTFLILVVGFTMLTGFIYLYRIEYSSK